MPRRNNDQKFKRNATRRDNTTRNRKAVFCLKHLELTKPEIFKEAIGLYEFVNAIYPNKHDLTKTTLYQKTIKGENIAFHTANHDVQVSASTATADRTISVEVVPVLNIPLIEAPVEIPQQNQQDVIEIPFNEVSQQSHQGEIDSLMDDLLQNHLDVNEMESLMDDLMQDPDLRNFFNQVEVLSGESRPKTIEEEIESIINDEIQRMDTEFKALIDY